jgi:hypothetical protein
LYLTKEQINEINQIYESNEKILDSTYMSKINKVFSYITYILKEIHTYINTKINDQYLPEINTLAYEINRLKEKHKLIRDSI